MRLEAGAERRSTEHPDLLHDACLRTGAYDPETRELRLTYECMRRNTDGSPMDDRTVTLHLVGVTSVIAAYDPPWPMDRPSDFRLPEDVRLPGLAPWPLPAMEVELSLDSATSAESLSLSAHRESLVETRVTATANVSSAFT
ncbi:MAG: hypothetical protein ACRBN8_28860 [Nannocystales bacterium]